MKFHQDDEELHKYKAKTRLYERIFFAQVLLTIFTWFVAVATETHWLMVLLTLMLFVSVALHMWIESRHEIAGTRRE